MTIMHVDVPPPTEAELGHAGGMAQSWHHQLGPGYKAQGYEENLDLDFHGFIRTVDLMRRTDGQVGALLRSLFLPILRNRYSLASKGCSARVVKLVETEIGLYADESDRIRQPAAVGRSGVILKDHLREACLAAAHGFAAFNRYYSVGPATKDQLSVAGMPDTVAHLAKLAPRTPRTVQEIRVNRDGSLAGIIQAGVGWDMASIGANVQIIGSVGGGAIGGADDNLETWISSQDLAFYCYEREGADWGGQSILRPVYKDWLIKDQMIRTDAIAGERNGLGVPVVSYDPTQGGTKEEALKIGTAFRSGATAGVAIETGKYAVQLIGVTGQVRDLLPSIKYHDQAVSRSALAMFLDLGQTASGLGQGSLGDTFLDYFVMAEQVFNDWLCTTFTETVIRDLVAVNFGTEEPYPALICDEISAESTPTADALKTLVDAKILTPDTDLEVETRRRYKLTAMKDPEATIDRKPTPAPAPGLHAVPAPLPDVTLAPTTAAPTAGTPATAQGGVSVVPSPAAPPAPVKVPTAASAGADALLDRAEALVARIAQLRAGT